MYLHHSYSLSHSGGSFVGLYSRKQKPFRSSVPDGTLSPELEVKHANKNLIGCFSKIYVTRHQSISIQLSFETSSPPFCFVQRAGGSQRWELLASQRCPLWRCYSCQCQTLLHNTKRFLLSGQLYWSLTYLLEVSDNALFLFHRALCWTLTPTQSQIWRHMSPGEEVLSLFPFSVVQSPPSLCNCLCCKQDDLKTMAFTKET